MIESDVDETEEEFNSFSKEITNDIPSNISVEEYVDLDAEMCSSAIFINPNQVDSKQKFGKAFIEEYFSGEKSGTDDKGDAGIEAINPSN